MDKDKSNQGQNQKSLSEHKTKKVGFSSDHKQIEILELLNNQYKLSK